MGSVSHNHSIISIRRRAGKLKAEREKHGLDPEYRKKKSIKTWMNLFLIKLQFGNLSSMINVFLIFPKLSLFLYFINQIICLILFRSFRKDFHEDKTPNNGEFIKVIRLEDNLRNELERFCSIMCKWLSVHSTPRCWTDSLLEMRSQQNSWVTFSL